LIILDQHGNILANTEINNVRKLPVINHQLVTNKKPNNGISSNNFPPVTNNDQTVKKESRLKHFFSPIRKKSIIAQAQVSQEISQPDVFISNILPCNMSVNPNMQSEKMVQEISSMQENVNEASSPTSSFQVCIIFHFFS
jgi:hypothetical protein